MKRILLFAILIYPALLLAQAPTATFTPVNAATNVSVTNNLTISYNQAIRNIDDSGINNGNVGDLISLQIGAAIVGFNATISGNTITIDPNATLLEETTYTLTIAPVENSANQGTGPLAITFTTGDFTDPTLNSARIINNNGTTFTFEATINDQGTIFYVVTTSSSIPSEAQVEAGQDHTGAAVAAGRFGSFAVTANNPGTASITGLAAGTKYRVHYFGRDEGGNDFDPETRNEPQINLGNTSAHTPTATGFTLSVEFDMDGTVYYVVTTSATPPSAATILAGQSFLVTDDDQIDEAVTGLSGATTYYAHFLHVNGSGSHSEIRSESVTTLDNIAPTVVSLNPTDGSITVDVSTNTFTITFNENIDNINVAAVDATDRVRLFEEGVMVEDIDRNDTGVGVDGAILADGTTATATITFVYTLLPGKNYNIFIGEDVFEDLSTNDFDGFLANTDWNFTTSGVTINNLVNNICAGSLQTLGNIEISENGNDDFNNSGSIILELVNTTDFAFSTSGITLSETGSDITMGVPTATFSTLTIPYTRSGGTTIDKIIVSGVRVLATGGSLSTTIRRSGGTANHDGNNGTGGASLIYAQISVGASPPAAPSLAALQDLNHCDGEDISAKTLTLVDQGVTVNYAWYSDASLSTLETSSTNETVNIVTDLGLTPTAIPGTYKFYVVAISSCQSTSTEVTIQVVSNPVVNAGTDPAAICFGQSVQIGGTPTLVSTSIPGAHTYSWATPGGTISSATSPNPTVTPPTPGSPFTDFSYTVTVTAPAPYGCTASDIIVIRTKEVTAPAITTPAQFTFNVNNDPIQLAGTPSISSFFSGTAVYLAGGNYYFDPEVAGLGTHNVTYTTQLSNGCASTVTQPFVVNNASNQIFGLASSYCSNEGFDDISFNGSQWQIDINNFNATSLFFDYTFHSYVNYPNNPDPDGLVNLGGGNYRLFPQFLDHPFGNYTYIELKVQRTDNAQILTWGYAFVQIYSISPVFFSGLNSGSPVPFADDFCNNSSQSFNLAGNFSIGLYEISRNNVNWFDQSDGVVGITNNPGTGQAIFNPGDAFNSTTLVGAGSTYRVRYTVTFAGTQGSTGSACTNAQSQIIAVNPLPTVSFSGATPADNQKFCYDDPSVTITGSTNGTSVSFFGYGINNIGSNQATFDPDVAFEAKEIGDNTTYTTEQAMVITARATSIEGCINETTRTLNVRALPPATFVAPPRLVYCYEDATFQIDGTQTIASYAIIFRNSSPPNFNAPGIPSPDFNFNAKNYFDQAVGQGANGANAQDFAITYTTDDGSGLGCTNATTITLTVNPPAVLNINGTDPGDVFCENGGILNLTGNFTGSGRFETSVNGSVFSPTGNGLINGNLPTGDGTANLNLFQAYDAANNIAGPNSPREPFYIQYIYRGPTCTGDAVYTDAIEISPPPTSSFIGATPTDNTAFCYDQSTSPASVPIITNTPANTTLSLTGTGTTYNTSTGIGSFNPTLAFKQRELDLNTSLTTDQSFTLTATAVDNTYGCTSIITKPLIARALPPSSFLYANKLNYCYEDPNQLLDGQQLTASYKIVYKNTTSPANYEVTLNQPDITFDPDVYFEDAVLKGANRLATLRFDIIYTATAGTGCTNRLDTVKFNVSPLIKGEIKGIVNSDIFCSNITDKKLEFTPSNGVFRVNGAITPVINDQYIFDPPIPGPASGTNYTFTYTVITGSNCTNTETKSVKVLPSPRALFSVVPKCDTALIAFNALSSTNLTATQYTWTLSDSVRIGQNLQHRFPGVSTYSVQLKTEHPPFPTTGGLVCADSLRLDQIVGPYPRIDFDFFNVCEEDNTDFDVNSNIPISDVRWEFGDDPGSLDVVPFGLMSNNIPGIFAPKTTGTFEKPRHQYAGAGNFQVIVMGRTANNFGGCVDTVSRQISILKKIIPPGNKYSMADLDAGRGHWVVEDQAGNSSWEFAVPTGARIRGTTPAWTTDADGTYFADDNSYVNSPCFDLSGYVRPVLSMQQWIDTPPSDGAVLQVSVNGGQTWNRVGNIASGLEWYNKLTISSNPGEQTALSTGWSREDQVAWATGKHSLDGIPVTGRDKVRFRIAFASFNNKESKDGFAFSNVVIEERNKTILVENFTNLTSTDNNNSFQDFRANPVTKAFNLNELVKLQYHPGVAVTEEDQLFNDNPVDQNARAAFYGVTQPNRAYIDGGYDGTALNQTFQGNWIDNYFSLRSLVTSPLSITTPATLPTDPSDKFNIQAIITADATVPVGKYHVFIAIAEKDILGQKYVLRKLLPNASGTPLTALTVSSPQQVINVSSDLRNVSKNSSGNFNPIAVIVFVQDIEGNKDVLQTYIREIDTPPSNIVSGTEGSDDLYFSVYPNPADQEMTISLPEAAKQRTALTMYDQMGKLVKESHFEKGDKQKTIGTERLSGGVYLIQIDTPKGVLRRKTMVLHRN